jgi:hypothetical protein
VAGLVIIYVSRWRLMVDIAMVYPLFKRLHCIRRCKGGRGRWGDGRIGYALTCDGLKRLAAGNNTNKGGEKEGMLTVILFSIRFNI